MERPVTILFMLMSVDGKINIDRRKVYMELGNGTES